MKNIGEILKEKNIKLDTIDPVLQEGLLKSKISSTETPIYLRVQK